MVGDDQAIHLLIVTARHLGEQACNLAVLETQLLGYWAASIRDLL